MRNVGSFVPAANLASRACKHDRQRDVTQTPIVLLRVGGFEKRHLRRTNRVRAERGYRQSLERTTDRKKRIKSGSRKAFAGRTAVYAGRLPNAIRPHACFCSLARRAAALVPLRRRRVQNRVSFSQIGGVSKHSTRTSAPVYL